MKIKRTYFIFILIIVLVVLFLIFNNSKPYSDVDFSKRLQNISGAIKKNYSINGQIRFIFKNISIGAAETRRYPFKGYVVIIDKSKLNNINDFELKGLLSHELSHLETYSKMNFIQLLIYALHYELSDDFKKQVERSTDMIAIEKGYGQELADYREFRLKTSFGKEKEFLEKNYLSVEEIEKLS